MKPSVLLDLVAQAGGSLVIDADLVEGRLGRRPRNSSALQQRRRAFLPRREHPLVIYLWRFRE